MPAYFVSVSVSGLVMVYLDELSETGAVIKVISVVSLVGRAVVIIRGWAVVTLGDVYVMRLEVYAELC